MEDTRQEIHRVGHRKFVGGNDEFWDLIRDLQFRFLVDRGLAPSDMFIDVGCGPLRGGVTCIRYLEPGHYLGIDKYVELVIYGVVVELDANAYREKQPRFVISDSFEFKKFGEKPTFGIAQSLFTHLAAHDVVSCLSNLRTVAAPRCRLFATFFEVAEPVTNPAVSHSHGRFSYTRSQMEEFGTSTGWKPHYIGEWNHPRRQKIIEYAAH